MERVIGDGVRMKRIVMVSCTESGVAMVNGNHQDCFVMGSKDVQMVKMRYLIAST